MGFNAFAGGEHHAEEEKLDVAGNIFGHIGDAHDWHFFTIGDFHATIPLPIILYNKTEGNLKFFSSSKFEHGHATYDGYRLDGGKIVAENGAEILDFSITKNVASMLLAVTILLLIMFNVSKKYKTYGTTKAPSGMQNAIEACVVFVRDEVAKPNIGSSYMKFLPFLLTIFFFIWINNLIGLIPGGANSTGNIAVTACLAAISFIVMLFTSKKYFWGHLFNPPGLPIGVKMLLVPIEFISLLIKPVALMIRLFANMLAGHIVILSFIMLIFIFGELNRGVGAGFSVVSVGLAVFSFLIELLVTAIQAFIFANLTAVFIGQMVEEHHHDEAHAH